MVTAVPTGPEVGDRLVMPGATVTVNGEPLLANPPTVTTTLPVVAPPGTRTVMLLSLEAVASAAMVPLNVTVLLPWLAPKFVPLMVTALPTGPEVGDRLLMPGATVTVNGEPLLANPPTVTTTLPVVAPPGTLTVMLLALQAAAAAAVVPLNVTVLLPWLAPKFVPVMVTAVPTGPEVGDRLVMPGATVTVTGEPLLANPPTVTTTLPVVAPPGTLTVMLLALQAAAAAAVVPLNVTVLLPCVAPKF